MKFNIDLTSQTDYLQKRFCALKEMPKHGSLTPLKLFLSAELFETTDCSTTT